MRPRLLAALAAFLLANPANAEEQKAPPLSIKSAEISRYDTIKHYDANESIVCCAGEVLESGPDHDFVYMHILLDIEWTEELNRISYYGGDAIRLKLPGQSDPDGFIAPWGTMDWYPEVRIVTPSINENRDRKWPDVDNDTYLEAFFTVPSDVKEATLVIGKKDEPQTEFPLDLSGSVKTFEPAGSFWEIEITGLEAVDEIETQRDLRGANVSGRIKPDMGSIVRVDMSMTPKRDLKVDRLNGSNAAYFVSQHIALVGPEGLPLAIIGEARSNNGSVSVSNSNSSTTNWQGEGTTGKVERTFYFLGSAASGDYQLWFKDVNVGTATLK